LSSPLSEVKYKSINKSLKGSNIAPDIKELAAKIQQHISYQSDTFFELGYEPT
jgi:hypothetical protein